MDHQHDSIWEATVCDYLYGLVKNKRIRAYLPQKSIDIKVKGKHICCHVIDFLVHKKGGARFFCEAKGFENPVWGLKRKLTQALYPKIPYVTVYRGQLDLIDKEIGGQNK